MRHFGPGFYIVHVRHTSYTHGSLHARHITLTWIGPVILVLVETAIEGLVAPKNEPITQLGDSPKSRL